MPVRQVLVADDDARCRGAMTRMLAPLALEIAEAHSGFSALELVRWRRFDLFIIDALMAPMSGVELIERLHWLGVTAPVLVVSSLDADTINATLAAPRALRHVRKPVVATALVAAVTAALEPTMA